jgi:hypothetical protein
MRPEAKLPIEQPGPPIEPGPPDQPGPPAGVRDIIAWARAQRPVVTGHRDVREACAPATTAQAEAHKRQWAEFDAMHAAREKLVALTEEGD